MLWYSPPQVVIYSFFLFLLLFFSTLGAGIIFWRPQKIEDWISTWAVGSAVFLTVLLFIALWHPISGRFSLVLAIILLWLGWVASYRFLRLAKPKIIEVVNDGQLIFLVIPIMLGVISAGFIIWRRSIFSIDSYDTWLYHWPMADWLRYGPIPWGWSWLHIRFGFLDAGFLLTTWLASMLPANSVLSAVNSYWMMMIIILSCYGCYESWKNPKNQAWFWLAAGLPLVVGSSSALATINSMAPELGVFLFGWLAIFFAMRKQFSLALVLVATTVAIKISAVFLLPLIIFLWWHENRQWKNIPWMGLGSSLVCIMLWVLAIIKSTGYLLFPIWFTKLPLPYSIPTKTAQGLQASIYSIARFNPYRPHYDNFFAWILHVFIPSIPVLYLALVLLGLVGIVIACVRRPRIFLLKSNQPIWVFLILAGILITQFLSAPDLRLLWPAFAWWCGSAILIWQPLLIRNIFWFKNILILSVWWSMMEIFMYFSPYIISFAWRDLITRPSESFHSDQPYQHASGIPFAFTVPPTNSDQCGLAAFPCLRNASNAAMLRYTINKKGWITKIVPGENVPEMP